MNYCSQLFLHDRNIRSHLALYDLNDGNTLTYGSLQDGIRRLAHWFGTQGLTPGEIVAIHLHNSIETAIVHMALQCVGITSAFIDPLAQPKSLGYYVADTKCAMLFTHAERAQLPDDVTGVTRVIRSGELDQIIYNADGALRTEPPVAWQEDEVSYIYYTSGTTSQPKGVMLTPGTHQIFFAFARNTGSPWMPPAGISALCRSAMPSVPSF